jgi:ADP-L-glycero-D-manno-heptose 6-epimerase
LIIITGGAGFIGSNLVRALNARGTDDVIVADDLTDGRKFRNLIDCQILDYLDKDELLERLDANLPWSGEVKAVFHQGACTRTTEQDGRLMMRDNYAYSRQLLELCFRRGWPFIYASSAAVYGRGGRFSETEENECPANVYAYSKYLFDCYVRRRAAGSRGRQVVGLRYFNVYGNNESHKGDMASIVFQLNRQLLEHGELRLFEGSDGYGAGEQRRDFIFVDDVVAVNLWMLDHPDVSGIFNVGTGRSESFNAVARAIIDWHGKGTVRYVPFPTALADAYQSFTEADLGRLRAAGCHLEFRPVASGIRDSLERASGSAGPGGARGQSGEPA